MKCRLKITEISTDLPMLEVIFVFVSEFHLDITQEFVNVRQLQYLLICNLQKSKIVTHCWFLVRKLHYHSKEDSQNLYIVACQRDGVSNEPLGQRQDTGPGILWSVKGTNRILDSLFLLRQGEPGTSHYIIYMVPSK